MVRFFAGLTVGVVVALAMSAYAARIVGPSGTLDGWSVMVQGEEASSDPEVDVAGESRIAMERHGMTSDHEVLNAGGVE